MRAPELIGAVHWARDRLLNTDVLVQKLAGVPIAAIRSDEEAGQLIKAAALALAADLGKSESSILTVEETSAAQAGYAARALAAWHSASIACSPRCGSSADSGSSTSNSVASDSSARARPTR